MDHIGKVKITSNGLFSGTHILVDDKEIRVNRMIIEGDGKQGGLLVTLEVYPDAVDVEALEKNTELTITKE